MKAKLIPLLICILPSLSAHATLVNNGNGLIYDDVLNITWLQDANYANSSNYVTSNGRHVTSSDGQMSWDEAMEWAEQLNYAGFSEWRLPTVKPINGTNFVYDVSYEGNSDFGEHITSTQSELSYMYFVNLNNSSLHDSNFGCGPGAQASCLDNTGMLNNLESYNYWFGTEVEFDNDFAWSLNSQYGIQTPYDGKANEFHAWAVHPGDISTVPLPTAFWFFSSALIGLNQLKKRS